MSANAQAVIGSALHLAVSNGFEDIVSLLLKCGADINIKNIAGATPLHEAAYHCFKKMAKLLLDSGANVNAQDKFDNTPIYFVATNCSIEMVELLLDYCADKNLKNNNGETDLADTRITELINNFVVIAKR